MVPYCTYKISRYPHPTPPSTFLPVCSWGPDCPSPSLCPCATEDKPPSNLPWNKFKQNAANINWYRVGAQKLYNAVLYNVYSLVKLTLPRIRSKHQLNIEPEFCSGVCRVVNAALDYNTGCNSVYNKQCNIFTKLLSFLCGLILYVWDTYTTLSLVDIHWLTKWS